jgi:hypothetical protein
VSGNPASVTYSYTAGVGAYTISATATNEDGTFAASNTLVVNVLPAKPTFSDLSTPTIVVGTASVTIVGKLNANAGTVMIPAGQIVQVRLYGVTQNVAIDASGNFSAMFATNSLKRDRSYTIVFRYAGDTNFGAAAGSSTLTVKDYTAPQKSSYWRTNPSEWSVDSLMLGGYEYSKAELLSLLRASANGDARIVLARELIAAKLNLASGSNPGLTASVVRDGDRLLRGRGKIVPGSMKVPRTSSVGKSMIKTATVLAIYPLVPGLR